MPNYKTSEKKEFWGIVESVDDITASYPTLVSKYNQNNKVY